MQILYTLPDGRLCLLAALPLEPATYNTIARAARAHPDWFVDEGAAA